MQSDLFVFIIIYSNCSIPDIYITFAYGQNVKMKYAYTK